MRYCFTFFISFISLVTHSQENCFKQASMFVLDKKNDVRKFRNNDVIDYANSLDIFSKIADSSKNKNVFELRNLYIIDSVIQKDDNRYSKTLFHVRFSNPKNPQELIGNFVTYIYNSRVEKYEYSEDVTLYITPYYCCIEHNGIHRCEFKNISTYPNEKKGWEMCKVDCPTLPKK